MVYLNRLKEWQQNAAAPTVMMFHIQITCYLTASITTRPIITVLAVTRFFWNKASPVKSRKDFFQMEHIRSKAMTTRHSLALTEVQYNIIVYVSRAVSTLEIVVLIFMILVHNSTPAFQVTKPNSST